jgi:hypothetical protein
MKLINWELSQIIKTDLIMQAMRSKQGSVMKFKMLKAAFAGLVLTVNFFANATLIISNLEATGSSSTCINYVCTAATKDAGWTMGSSSFDFINAILRLDLYNGEVTPLLQLYSGLTPTTLQKVSFTIFLKASSIR